MAIVIITLGILAAYAAMMAGASFAGFLGETLMIVSALVAIVAWGIFAGLTVRALLLVRSAAGERLGAGLAWSRHLPLVAAILAIITAFPLALGAFATCGPVWLPNLYHWGGLAGSVLGFVAWFAMPFFMGREGGAGGEHARPHSWRALGITAASVYGLWGLTWLIAWVLLRGSINTGAYPARAASPYRLPFPAGDSSWVIQGNNSSFNHEGSEEHAWDFRRRCGTPVLAARAGTVTKVVDKNTGHGGGKPNNLVEVSHGDGTVGRYLHIEQNSAKIAVGAAVTQGQQLANAGNVGNSLTGHIHFVVERGGNSIPVSFGEVEEDSGIPRTFNSYTSGNR